MNVSNEKEIMIFKNDNGKYSFQISKKNLDGSYSSAYFPIQFNKGVELDNRTLIKIKNAWISFYNWEYENKKGTTFFIKCNDFEEIESKEIPKTQKEEKNPFEEFGEQLQIDESELPF